MPEQDFENYNQIVAELSKKYYKKIVNRCYSDFNYEKGFDYKIKKKLDFDLPDEIASNLFLTLLERLKKDTIEKRKIRIKVFPMILKDLYKEAKRNTFSIKKLGNIRLVRKDNIDNFYEKVKDLQNRLDGDIDEQEAQSIIQFDETLKRNILVKGIDIFKAVQQNDDDDSEMDHDSILSHFKPVTHTPSSLVEKKEVMQFFVKLKIKCFKQWKESKSSSSNIQRDYKIVLYYFFKETTNVWLARHYGITPKRVGMIVSSSQEYIIKCIKRRFIDKFGYDVVQEYI